MSIRQTLKEKSSWFLAEILVVVAGVLIALSLNSWNDAIGERESEQAYIANLEKDLQATIQSLEDSKNATAFINAAGTTLLEQIDESKRTISTDSLTRLTSFAFLVYPFSPIMSTYNDMLNSGKLDLIQSEELRLKLSQHQGWVNELEYVYLERFNQWSSLQVPYMIEHMSIASFMGGSYKTLEFPQSDVARNLRAVQDPRFENLVVSALIGNEDVLSRAEIVINSADSLLTLVAELKGN